MVTHVYPHFKHILSRPQAQMIQESQNHSSKKTLMNDFLSLIACYIETSLIRVSCYFPIKPLEAQWDHS